jgi:zinc protease
MSAVSRTLASFIGLLFLAVAAATPGHAFVIQSVTSPGGIKAWLVQDKTIPLIAMNFSFQGGSAYDPPGKEGLANFITGMLDEGADDVDSQTFQKRREELAFKMSFDVGRDHFEGRFQTLTRNRDASFDLLRKAITKPRFAADAVERVRKQFELAARDQAQDPEQTATDAWMKQALPGDPYAHDPSGSEASLSTITADDLRAAHDRIFRRATLQVAVVGDIDAATLGKLLDQTFGGLPQASDLPKLPPARIAAGPSRKVINSDNPQSVIVFGGPGILRSDPAFIPAYIMTEILGGGSLSSRLTREIREKRGLTYGVSADLVPLRRVGLLLGSLGTRNAKAGEALALVRQEFDRMAKSGPTQAELDEAKTFLEGSYALHFSGNAAIAGQLLGLQQENLGIDYIDKRNARLAAVTLDDVKAQAARIVNGDTLIVTVVGQPQGLPN